MISKEIEFLIVKYFSQSADTTDLDVLNNWIASKENQVIFKEYVKTHFAINLAMNDPDLNTIRKLLLKEIRKNKTGFYGLNYLTVLKYAAIAVLFLGLGFIWQRNIFEFVDDKQIVPREDAITLELENGNIEIIAENGTSKILNANGNVVGVQKGKQLVYEDKGTESKLTYNTLSIPNGKRFNIVLSDGSRVHLNSGSSMTYPVKFVKDSIRKVYLTGEAYFEVTYDRNHLFVVNTQDLDVQVYGTKFNVANYPEDRNTEIVLVEGSVSLAESGKLETDKNEVFLKPGYKGTFNKTNKSIVNEKVNTALYTSWMNGNLVFRNATFENITQKLERHYNVVIINNNEKLGRERFNATIETGYETIEQVFNYFNKVYQIEYRIVENKIIIN